MQCQKTNREKGDEEEKKKLESIDNKNEASSIHSGQQNGHIYNCFNAGDITHGDSKSAFPHEA